MSLCAGKDFATGLLYCAKNFPTVLMFATRTGFSHVRSLIKAGINAVTRSDVGLHYDTKNLKWMATQKDTKRVEENWASSEEADTTISSEGTIRATHVKPTIRQRGQGHKSFSF